MTTEEFYTLSDRCKGRYLRIDHNSDKTLLIYSPAVEPAGQGNLILRSSDAYKIRRYVNYPRTEDPWASDFNADSL